jgi:hypothetical protein
MTANEREIPFGTTTILRLFPVGDISLLREISGQFSDIVVEERETEGQKYRPMITSATQLRYFNRTSVVPEGYVHVAITSDPRKFPSIWNALERKKQKAAQTPKSI